MKEIKYLFFLLMIFMSQVAFSQKGFIHKGKKATVGLTLIKGSDHNNAQYIRVNNKKEKKIIKYTPDDITAYGFEKRSTFTAFELELDGQKKRFFFERLYKGKYDVYYFGLNKASVKFFIARGDKTSLDPIPLAKKDYIAFIGQLIQECPQGKANLNFLQLTKDHVKRFFKNYGTCSESNLPRLRYGVEVGISSIKYSPNASETNVLNSADLSAKTGYFVGATLEYPIKASNFSLVSGLRYHKFRGADLFDTNDKTYDLIVKQSRIEVPFLVRYTRFSQKTSPYLGVGVTYSQNLSGESTLYSYHTIGDQTFVDEAVSGITNKQFGLTVESGAIWRYSTKHSLKVQVSYHSLKKVQSDLSETMGTNNFLFTLGLLF